MEICTNLHGIMWRSVAANNCNTFYIDGSNRILIDPGHMKHFDRVKRSLADLGVSLDQIDLVLCTHAHPDHIEGVQFLKRAGARFAIHRKDWEMAKTMISQMDMASQIDLHDFRPDFFLKGGELTIGDIDLQVVHTPGHSPGSVCFYWPLHKALVSGDLVFKEGVGRTDLPGGNGQQLKRSIEQVAAMPITHLLPGHGEIVSGTKAVQSNFKRIGQIYMNYF